MTPKDLVLVEDSYFPLLVVPPEIRNLDPAWANCEMYMYMRDPPYKLSSVTNIAQAKAVETPVKTTAAEPASAIAPAIPSKTTQPFTPPPEPWNAQNWEGDLPSGTAVKSKDKYDALFTKSSGDHPRPTKVAVVDESYLTVSRSGDLIYHSGSTFSMTAGLLTIGDLVYNTPTSMNENDTVAVFKIISTVSTIQKSTSTLGPGRTFISTNSSLKPHSSATASRPTLSRPLLDFYGVAILFILIANMKIRFS